MDSRQKKKGRKVGQVFGRLFWPSENGREVSNRGYFLVNPLSFCAACVAPLNSTKQQLTNLLYREYCHNANSNGSSLGVFFCTFACTKGKETARILIGAEKPPKTPQHGIKCYIIEDIRTRAVFMHFDSYSKVTKNRLWFRWKSWKHKPAKQKPEII